MKMSPDVLLGYMQTRCKELRRKQFQDAAGVQAMKEYMDARIKLVFSCDYELIAKAEAELFALRLKIRALEEEIAEREKRVQENA